MRRLSAFVTIVAVAWIGLCTQGERFLNRHAALPQFVYRHRWRVHDVVMWDNRCTIHHAVDDYDSSERRHMHRTTITGGRPV